VSPLACTLVASAARLPGASRVGSPPGGPVFGAGIRLAGAGLPRTGAGPAGPVMTSPGLAGSPLPRPTRALLTWALLTWALLTWALLTWALLTWALLTWAWPTRARLAGPLPT
jgi:hypothetical protein